MSLSDRLGQAFMNSAPVKLIQDAAWRVRRDVGAVVDLIPNPAEMKANWHANLADAIEEVEEATHAAATHITTGLHTAVDGILANMNEADETIRRWFH